MSTRYTIEGSTLQGIANAIRSKNGSDEGYTPEEMISAIDALDLESGGVDPDALELTVNEDGLAEVVLEGEVIKSKQIDSSVDNDLVAANIRENTTILGITGTMSEGSPLNFSIVGGLPVTVGGEEVTAYTLTNKLSEEKYYGMQATAGNPNTGYGDLGTYSVIKGHQYYIRAISATYGVFTWGGVSQVLYNGQQLTTQNAGVAHTLWVADTDTLTIQLLHKSQCAETISAGCTGRLYAVIDTTNAPADAVTSPDVFWLNIGSEIFYGEKTFGGDATVESFPPVTNPTENTIWVNTDRTITSHRFAATEPADATEGMVWIRTGVVSPVAFDPIENFTVYPVLVSQYINGLWVDKVAQTFQNGQWVDWTTWFFHKGDQCVGLTSGWEVMCYASGSGGRGDQITLDSNNLTITASLGSTAHELMQTLGKVDVTDLSTINFVISQWEWVTHGTGGTTSFTYTFGLSTNVQNTNTASSNLTGVVKSVQKVRGATTGAQVITLDVSDVEGSYYLFLDFYNYYLDLTFVLTDIYGEA